MKPKGTSIIFYNNNNEILLFLRDDKPTIPFPNKWDILGGHVEDETVTECIKREMLEEISIDIGEPNLFDVYDFEDRIETTFYKKQELDIEKTALNEGQCLKWFGINEIQKMSKDDFAFNFKEVLTKFIENKLRKT
jgi:8-oxo-dGTP diphosphatase